MFIIKIKICSNQNLKPMKKLNSIFIAFVFCFATNALAQSKISGTVIADDGSPLPELA